MSTAANNSEAVSHDPKAATTPTEPTKTTAASEPAATPETATVGEPAPLQSETLDTATSAETDTAELISPEELAELFVLPLYRIRYLRDLPESSPKHLPAVMVNGKYLFERAAVLEWLGRPEQYRERLIRASAHIDTDTLRTIEQLRNRPGTPAKSFTEKLNAAMAPPSPLIAALRGQAHTPSEH